VNYSPRKPTPIFRIWLKKWRFLWAWLLEICGTRLLLGHKLWVVELPSLATQAQWQLICLFHSTFLFKQRSTFSFNHGLSRHFKRYQSVALYFRSTRFGDPRRWVHHKECLRINLWFDHRTLMVNIIVGGRITWKTTFKLMIMSYGWSQKMVHSFLKRQQKMGRLFPRNHKNSMLMILKWWTRIRRPKSFCILALVLMRTLALLSASQPKRYRMPSK